MPGRHASHVQARKPRWPRRLAVITVLLAAIAAGGYAARDYIPDLVDRFTADSCDGSVPVEVVASPDIAPALTAIIEDDEADETPNVAGTCIEANITALPSGEAAASIEGGMDVDLWVADSSMWLDRVSDDEAAPEQATAIASSPLVAAVGRPIAEEMGWPAADFSWQAALDSDANAAIVDPSNNTAGFATLLAVSTVLGGGEDDGADQSELVAALTAMSKNTAETAEDAFDSIAENPEEAPIFTVVEQSVVAYNQGTDSTSVVALYPDEGTFVFDYPALPLTPDGSTAESRAAVNSLIQLFTSDKGTVTLQDHGFRAPDGSVGELAGIGDGIDPLMPEALPTPPPEAGRDILRQWSALSIDMRMLAVIDVSGSMIDDDGGDATRAELVRDAATTALGLFRQTNSVGIWAFSTLEDDPRHWRELVPVGPLDEDLGEHTRIEALAGAANQIPELVEDNVQEPLKGWTALYDTTLAAFETVQNDYEAGKVNSIVLMTDGSDEWPDGLQPEVDLETLLSNLESHDPAQPIPVIAIGIGPDADMDALRQIASATGGAAHLAEDPADIQEVFFQAMVDRQCRPNCG